MLRYLYDSFLNPTRGFAKHAFALFFAAWLLGFNAVQAQHGAEPFFVNTVSVLPATEAASGSRLDLYIGVPFSDLQFLKVGERFEAGYELSAEVYRAENGGARGDLVANPVWQETARTDQFSATQSSLRLARSTYSMRVAPGRYMVELKVRDLASDRQLVQEFPVRVRQFASEVSVSDLVLVEGYDEARQSISPVMHRRVVTRDSSFSFFYEIYADETQTVRVTREVARIEKRGGIPVLRWVAKRWRDQEVEDLAYTTAEGTRVRKGRNPFLVTIPISDFELGEYLVRVRIEDSATGWTESVERRVYVDRRGVEEYRGRSVDQAIAQMRLLAKPKDLAFIQAGETEQERWERFEHYWAKRDPTPDSPDVNERMDAYYSRIDFANLHYSGQRRGWETDRGSTLVSYGEPDEIERGRADANTRMPYEIWNYSRIGKRFVFVDRSGRGDYELLKAPAAARPF